MNKKNLIKYVTLCIVIIVILFICFKIFTKNPSENNQIEPTNINPRHVVYKRFEFDLPEGMSYTTDEYKIYINGDDNWTAIIDPILDKESSIKNNAEKSKELLSELGYVINEGPIDINAGNVNYFYYKVKLNDVDRILAYYQLNPTFTFEVEYESLNEQNNDLSILDSIINSLSTIKYDDSEEKKYMFHVVNFN